MHMPTSSVPAEGKDKETGAAAGAAAPQPEPAQGYGPNNGGAYSQESYQHPAAGWGASWSVARIMMRHAQMVDGTRAVFNMNHQDGGYDCPGCAWPDDQKGLKMDICENGIKHTLWESDPRHAGRDFFAAHTVTELLGWSDFALENAGRLMEPMQYDAATDKYVPLSWDEAFELAGQHLRGLASPDEAIFYTSGRLSNEGSFLFQLLARELGTNNLPDCSNMCHEASGRALMASIATNKGTVDLDDWEATDCLFLLGVNAASNAPRMLTSLAAAYRRGAQIVHINPLVEAAATRTIVPHDFVAMATFQSTPVSTLNIQPKIAGDMALMRGVAKHLFEVSAKERAIDWAFIAEYTSGISEYQRVVEATTWDDIEKQSGIAKAVIQKLGEIYRNSKAAIFAWCLGISQQQFAVDTVREIMNVLLLRGNIGRKGAGPCPIRGHSNVQGNRTCGINHQPTESWLARIDAACGIKSPRSHGLTTVTAIPAMMRGEAKVFVGMGGNFVRAVPDTEYTAEAMKKCTLTIQVSTKLNRSHLIHGREALILPCLGRTEKDMGKGGGLQGITVEDSMSMVHLSYGMKEPISPELRSELAIISGLARAAMPESRTLWEEYGTDYNLVRDKMAEALEGFEDFNERVRRPRGFRIRQPARELVFRTDIGRAKFSTALLADTGPAKGRLLLATVRSHDQWNTTIYSDDDRYRGVKNLRTLIFMNEGDMKERGLKKFDLIDATSFAKDGTTRHVYGYRAVPYDLPAGCAVGYMPELNVLCPIGDFSEQSEQPMMKHIVVEIVPSSGSGRGKAGEST